MDEATKNNSSWSTQQNKFELFEMQARQEFSEIKRLLRYKLVGTLYSVPIHWIYALILLSE